MIYFFRCIANDIRWYGFIGWIKELWKRIYIRVAWWMPEIRFETRIVDGKVITKRIN